MTEYYTWDESQMAIAQAALDSLNNNARLPLVGKNAKTGQLAPDKQKTTSWASEVRVFTEGMIGFPRIPKTLLDTLGVTQEEREEFITTFNPTIRVYDRSWELPVEDEELI